MNPGSFSRRLSPVRAALSEAKREVRRLGCQLEFARGFSGLVGFGEEVVARAQALADSGASLAEVEDALAPLAARAKDYRIVCVGHGHLDMNWMWSWPETVAACRDTFASALEIMSEDDEVCYSQSQTAVYAAMEKYHPELFERIRTQVKEGRWEVTAAQWVEGDKNLSGGDSLVRHYRYSEAYCREKLGVICPVQWEPDTFGHAGTIPMIAAPNGVRFYYACRTGSGFESPVVGKPRPPLFWWQSASGDRILVNRELSWYNSNVNIGENVALVALKFFGETGSKHWLNVFGIGNHGGGPTRAEIAYLREMRDWPCYPRVEFGTALSFFLAVEAEGLNLPVLDHELNFEFPGCYTSQSLIKQANRLGENFCLEADAMARMSGLDRPAAREEAWKTVLFNQFHDILPGSGVRQTREHATALFQECAALTGSIKGDAMRVLASRIDTLSVAPISVEASHAAGEGGHGLGALLSGVSTVSGGGSGAFPFIVFNPLGWSRTEPVALTLWDSGLDPSRVICVDSQGVARRALLVDKGREWDHDKLVFIVEATVPGLGWETLTLLEGDGRSMESGGVTIRSGVEVETPHLKAKFERFASGMRSLNDLGRVGEWSWVREAPHYMSAWLQSDEVESRPWEAHRFDLHGEERNAGTLEAKGEPPFVMTTQRLQAGPNKATVRTLVSAKSGRIDFEADLDWREIGTRETGAPGAVIDVGPASQVWAESPFGIVERFASDRDFPTLRFVKTDQFALLTSGKGGFGWNGERLRMRVIRSSYEPDPLPEVNTQKFRWSLALLQGSESDADLVRMGLEHNHPFLVCATGWHAGSESARKGALETERDDLVVSSCEPDALTVTNYGDQAASFRGHEIPAKSMRVVPA